MSNVGKCQTWGDSLRRESQVVIMWEMASNSHQEPINSPTKKNANLHQHVKIPLAEDEVCAAEIWQIWNANTGK